MTEASPSATSATGLNARRRKSDFLACRMFPQSDFLKESCSQLSELGVEGTEYPPPSVLFFFHRAQPGGEAPKT